MNRKRQRAPVLTPWDRLLLGVCTLSASPKRLNKMAVILRPSTLFRFHQALVKRKYRLLYSPKKRRRSGPKGPSKELISVIIEMKRRNPRLGCRNIAEQISMAFGIELNKDVVRRILARFYRPVSGDDCGPQKQLTLKPCGRRRHIHGEGRSRSVEPVLRRAGRVDGDGVANAPAALTGVPGCPGPGRRVAFRGCSGASTTSESCADGLRLTG
jgi:hypothetical protein